MFYKFLVLVLALTCTMRVNAADLIVEEFGLSPAFSSISDALAAANDGDRIFIKNRGGLVPWIENLSIDKSVQLLPFENDSIFLMEGSITITPDNNREITIIGMHNINGTINTIGAGSVSARTKVNLFSCRMNTAYIYLSNGGISLTMAGTTILDGIIY